MSDNNSVSLYNIPLDGECDMLGIYIDTTLPTLNIDEQIKAIERYLKATGSSNVSFVREGNTDCILICPDNFFQTKSVQWCIGEDLKTAQERINTIRDHFNVIGMQNQTINYLKTSCKKCGKTNNLKWCGRCHNVLYCSSICQRSDWKEHKKTCVKK